ncbi:hypothetical protein CALVIDRAFT_541909 [Calocera viscosa TUFC12733]|uniref:Uncharacterized protein n=1 Tax=Calocera viscosa (strain TUFC12733) TaxID=1330018 RepID=A0A167H9J5_CALVF|nr:hypothetical protein CALVIDRAFT_541909 [Calocera viscosa TUFC12733]
MTSFFSNILPTGLHIPSLPNPIAFLTKQEEVPPEQTQTESTKLQLDIPVRQPQQPHGEQQLHAQTHDNHEHAVSDSELHEDHGTRKKKQPSETFIIVRPPPAKNNHPLNLQIQLIPPNLQKEKPQRRSVELSRDEVQTPTTPESAASALSGNSLARRPSIRSDRSASLYSFATSSVTSLASTVSGRRVVPLYNLSAHNVMQNTVVDAGTDAKVAKFLKKGLDVAQVAYLEPIEFWERFSEDLLDRRMTRSDNSHPSQIEPIDEYTPRNSFSQERHSRAIYASPQPELLAPPKPEQKKQKKQFGKLFKRRNESISELSAVQPPPSPARSETLMASPSMSTMDQQLLTPTLGLQPTQGSKMALHNHNRAVSYVWVVRKWMKPTGENWLNKGLNNLRMGGPNQIDSLANIDLRFEWTRAGDAHRPRGRRQSIAEGTDSAVPSARNSIVVPGDATGLAPPFTYERSPTPSVKRRSVSPRASAMLRAPLPASAETSSTNSQSDSEDDDTPWTCTLHVSPQVKMRVAALIPAPHHPKLLGQVKIPFPLPDVALEQGVFLPRVDGEDNNEVGLLLTAEDIKDIIASTCLWLVVRESFGGIDKKRKGDGWRIRS